MSEQEQGTQNDIPEIELEARAQGWVPKEEFRGKESDWIDAEVFVQRGKEINPILRKNNERIQKELDAAKKQMEELRAATEEFKQFQKEAFDRKVEKYKQELSDLRELKKKAVSDGDGDLVVEIDDRIDAVKESQAKAKADAEKTAETKKNKSSDVTAPEVAAWVEKNTWYKSDTRMQAVTNAIAQTIRDTKPYLNGAEFLAELDKELEDTFTPEKLGRQTQKLRNPVEGSKPSGGSKSSTSKGYDSLPPEAKSACDKFVKQGILTREQYIADYYA